MVINDTECLLVKRGVLESIASKLAPKGVLRDEGCRGQPRLFQGFRGGDSKPILLNQLRHWRPTPPAPSPALPLQSPEY